jgi:hypothetical protein
MKIPDALNGICEATYNRLPSAKTVVHGTLTIMTGAIALEAISRLTTANAGPVTYALCVAACSVGLPPAIPACLAACAISLGPWCP